MNWTKVWEFLEGLKPAAMMMMVQAGLGGVNIFYKLAANAGLSLRVLIAYRFIFGAATVIPLALAFEGKKRPKLTWRVVFLTFCCAFFGGSLSQNLYSRSIVLTSATFASALTNIIPAVTFILAILFRMEGLRLNTWAGKAKVVGTLACISGAMLLTFFRGFEVKLWSTNIDLLAHNKSQPGGGDTQPPQRHILGCFLAILACFCTSYALILQAKIGKIYPSPYSSTALISLMGALQSTVYALCLDRDWSQWRLGWSVKLLAAVYMGVISSGILWAFMMIVVRMRGPLFVSVFNPLMLVVVAILSSLLLKEKIYLGTLVGAVIIISGLYTVLWGKSKEMKKLNQSLALSKSVKIEPSNTEEDDNLGGSFKGSGEASGSSVNITVVSNFGPPASDILEIRNGENKINSVDVQVQTQVKK